MISKTNAGAIGAIAGGALVALPFGLIGLAVGAVAGAAIGAFIGDGKAQAHNTSSDSTDKSSRS